MELTHLGLINNFDQEMKTIQNHSIFSYLLFPFRQSYLKYLAVALFALLVTFTPLLNRLKLLVFNFRVKSFIPSSPVALLHKLGEDYDFDFSEDEDDEEASSVSTVSDIEDEVDSRSSFEGKTAGEIFRFPGSGCLNNSFSWSDFSAGKSVVQLWENFGLGLDFEEACEVSVWDLDKYSVPEMD